jgi:hypothetical protein
MTTGTSQGQTRQRMETTMSDTSAPTRERKNGSQKSEKPVLQPWDLITLPISKRDDVLLDLEHASREDFGAWVVWNGVPLKGEVIWNFDNRCAVVNHCIQEGLKLRIIAPLPTNLETFWQLVEVVEPAPEAAQPNTKVVEELVAGKVEKRWIAGVLSPRGHRPHRKTVLWARYHRRRLHRRNHYGLFL